MGNSVLPFTNLEPKDSDAYQLITTKPEERRGAGMILHKAKAVKRMFNGSFIEFIKLNTNCYAELLRFNKRTSKA